MKIAVITGASSGIGAEFVRQLDAAENFDEIWVIARRLDKLEELSKDIANVKIKALKYDVSNIAIHDEVYNTLLNYPGTSPVIVVDMNNKPFKLNLKGCPSTFLINELHAYLKDEFIKLK